MNCGWKKRLGAFMLGIFMVFGICPAFADETESIEVFFEDISESDFSTLSGEAKIKVSVQGKAGAATLAQLDLSFSGDLKYKSIKFLTGENDMYNASYTISPNSALANAQKTLLPGIISLREPFDFLDKTDLFVLTFAGEPGQSVTLSLNNSEFSYCTIDGNPVYALEPTDDKTVTARETDNIGIDASIRLTMDKVRSFNVSSRDDKYAGTGLELKIIGKTTGSTFTTELNNIFDTEGGHRVDAQLPTFEVKEKLIADTYTVELSGLGYKTYRLENVDFGQSINITNEELIPGDVNGDGVIDTVDKELCLQASKDKELAESLGGAADFDRSGRVDEDDLKVFDGIAADEEEEASVPSKVTGVTVEGGEEKVTVTWTKPEGEVTGYIIKYGTSADSMTKLKTADADETSLEIKNLDASTKYYVSVGAKNNVGTGEYSDAVYAETAKAKEESSSGGGGGGGGGAVIGGNAGGQTGSSPTVPPTDISQAQDEVFKDLGNYSWAKESVYSLKDKGIISGTSADTYSPASNIKRGDFILILARMLKLENSFAENFADVSTSSYYYNAIGMAKAAGIATGDGVNFMPENTITRQDLITLAYRAFLKLGYIEEADDFSVLDEFSDKGDIASYAQQAMASMVKAGIIKGSGGSVNPKGNATRAEVAVMCARLYSLMTQ